MPFKFATGAGTDEQFSRAFKRAVDAASAANQSWDLVCLWWNSSTEIDCDIAELAKEQFGSAQVIGCSAESLVVGDQELEMDPAVCIWCAKLPGVQIESAHVEFVSDPDGGRLTGWPESLEGDWPAESFLLTIGDPYSFPMDWLLERFNEDRSGIPILGGMSSGASHPGESAIVFNGMTYQSGAVLVRLSGNIKLTSLVSQGCRPVGDSMVITKAERNQIFELGGVPAYQRLQEVFAQLSTSEQRAMNRGCFVGRVISEYQDERTQGDFLIRNLAGVDPESQSLVVVDYVKVGQTIQFHIRDHETASAELKQLLGQCDLSEPGNAGALLFSCNGRGTRLFPEPNHDAGMICQQLSGIGLAGFFAAGEIGPIGNKNFMHGFTASLAIMSENNPKSE